METREGKFSGLFEIIREYAHGDYDHQDKALQIIAGTYVFMFESEDMPDARPVVDEILTQYDYVFTTMGRGNLDPLSVDAVVRVALYKKNTWSGASTASAKSSKVSSAARATTKRTRTI